MFVYILYIVYIYCSWIYVVMYVMCVSLCADCTCVFEVGWEI